MTYRCWRTSSSRTGARWGHPDAPSLQLSSLDVASPSLITRHMLLSLAVVHALATTAPSLQLRTRPRDEPFVLNLRGGADEPAPPTAPSPAPTALTPEEITEKLNGIPVFALLNKEGGIVSMRDPDGGTAPVCRWFVDATEAKMVLEAALAANPGAQSAAQHTDPRSQSMHGTSPACVTRRCPPLPGALANCGLGISLLCCANACQGVEGLHIGVHGLGNAFKLCGGWPDEELPDLKARLSTGEEAAQGVSFRLQAALSAALALVALALIALALTLASALADSLALTSPSC